MGEFSEEMDKFIAKREAKVRAESERLAKELGKIDLKEAEEFLSKNTVCVASNNGDSGYLSISAFARRAIVKDPKTGEVVEIDNYKEMKDRVKYDVVQELKRTGKLDELLEQARREANIPGSISLPNNNDNGYDPTIDEDVDFV